MASYADKSRASQGSLAEVRSHDAAPGKQTLVEQIVAPVVQQRAADERASSIEATDARGQLDDQSVLLRDAAAGNKTIRLEASGRDVTGHVDLASDAAASKSTRGPAGKGFDKSLGVSASDLEALCKQLLAAQRGTAKGVP